MKKFFKQVFCFHSNWEESHIWKNVTGWAFYGYKEYACIDCDKRKLFKKEAPPINFVG